MAIPWARNNWSSFRQFFRLVNCPKQWFGKAVKGRKERYFCSDDRDFVRQLKFTMNVFIWDVFFFIWYLVISSRIAERAEHRNEVKMALSFFCKGSSLETIKKFASLNKKENIKSPHLLKRYGIIHHAYSFRAKKEWDLIDCTSKTFHQISTSRSTPSYLALKFH